MAKQIIILNYSDNGPVVLVTAAFWIPIPADRQISRPEAQSAWPGASPEEVAALKNGSVVEVVDSFYFPRASPANTIRSRLEAEYASKKSAESSKLPSKSYIGAYKDDIDGWRAP